MKQKCVDKGVVYTHMHREKERERDIYIYIQNNSSRAHETRGISWVKRAISSVAPLLVLVGTASVFGEDLGSMLS